MGRGLSQLQQWILVHAIEPKDPNQIERPWGGARVGQAENLRRDSRIDILISDILRGHYGCERPTASMRAAVSRALMRLVQRGLLSDQCVRKLSGITGVSLTLAGLAKAKALVAEMTPEQKAAAKSADEVHEGREPTGEIVSPVSSNDESRLERARQIGQEMDRAKAAMKTTVEIMRGHEPAGTKRATSDADAAYGE
jgi:hypothetical protein